MHREPLTNSCPVPCHRIIELSDRKRIVKDTETYWHLTPYGFRVMMNLKALKKKNL